MGSTVTFDLLYSTTDRNPHRLEETDTQQFNPGNHLSLSNVFTLTKDQNIPQVPNVKVVNVEYFTPRFGGAEV